MNSPNRFRNFIVTSLVLHSLFLLFMFFVPKFNLQNKSENIEVVLVDAKPTEVVKADPKRIVETDESKANKLENKDAKYLSAKNNTVDKETIAKLADTFKNSDFKKASKPSLFGEKFDPYLVLEKNSLEKQLNKQKKANSQQAELGDSSTATDRLEGVDQNLKTALNTKEYKYYGYYHRIKVQLNQWWQPQVRQKVSRLMTQGRTVASENSNKVTKLIIFLNEAGTLVKVQVISESGVRDLDDAAVEAFRQAAPFPNPPKGLVENDGYIKIRWDFVVES